MASRNIVTPPSPRGQRRVKRIAADSTKVPAFLAVPRRVQWDPVGKKVERDALKHDQLLALTRSSFSWAPSSTLTSNEWLNRPEVVPDILDKLSESKRHARQMRAATAVENGVRHLRESLENSSIHSHPRAWDRSEKVSLPLSKQLWRSPDPTPNALPDLNFRPNYRVPRGGTPWKPSEDYPHESGKYLKLSGYPVRVPSGRFHKFQTTQSYQSMVRPIVGNACHRIKTELDSIDDDGASLSTKNMKGQIKRDLAEMSRIWELVKDKNSDRITLKKVVLAIISMIRWKKATKKKIDDDVGGAVISSRTSRRNSSMFTAPVKVAPFKI